MTTPLSVENSVNLDRFMGAWYVLAHIPPPFTGDAYNAVETYKRSGDSQIDTHYRYNKGGLDGPEKVMRPRGFVVAGSGGAIWKMQFLWPFKSDYRISYLDADYTQTIVARQQRDYVWIMARSPKVDGDTMANLQTRTEQMGYDLKKLELIPHG